MTVHTAQGTKYVGEAPERVSGGPGLTILVRGR